MVLRTFSKVYGVGGASASATASRRRDVVGMVNRRALAASHSLGMSHKWLGMAALDDGRVGPDPRREHNSRELAYLQGELSRRKVVFTPSVANFVLVEFEAEVKELFAESRSSV